MIRCAMSGDAHDLFEIGKSLAATYIPELKMDPEKLHRLVKEAIADPYHFAWVSCDGPHIVGGLIALSGDNLWAQRRHSRVILWYTPISGDGIAMLRRYKAWIKEQRGIRLAGVTFECQTCSTIKKMLERVGFETRGGSNILFN